MSPLGQGLVKVEHRQVFAETPPTPRRDRPAGRAKAGWRCSQCLAVRLAGSAEWVEDEGPVGLAQDVCPSCARQVFETPPAGMEQSHG
jgi:hypothetical protein